MKYGMIHFVPSKNPHSYDLKNISLISGRSGTITTIKTTGGDQVFGGGAYDGRINIDPVTNSNSIRRAYFLAALHPDPKNVLVVGLGTGSWLKVVSEFPSVKKITVIEINPLYLSIIKKYPLISSILQDKKIQIKIDDGRRYLRKSTQKFDFILSNTMIHQREHATNLLSIEFLRLCKQHLNKGGVFYFNSTWSKNARITAATVFSNVITVGSFVAASDSPFNLSPAKIQRTLNSLNPSVRKFFQTAAGKKIVYKISHYNKTNQRAKILSSKGKLVTDNNMVVEYRKFKL